MQSRIVLGLGAVAASGAIAGAKGVSDLIEARKIVRAADERQQSAALDFDHRRAETQEVVTGYGLLQLSVQKRSVGGFITWLEKNERKVKKVRRELVDGVEVVQNDLPALKERLMETQGVLGGAATALVAGLAARTAALAGVQALASASTGTAISTLSGAAAQNATLAWLGGGSLASGGGGMAAGATVLSGVAIAPAVAISGFTLGVQGQKARTKAEEHRGQVDESIARIALAEVTLGGIDARVEELESVLTGLAARLDAAVRKLREVDFDPDDDEHAELFLVAAVLLRSVSEVLTTPILDESGDLTRESIIIIKKYKEE